MTLTSETRAPVGARERRIRRVEKAPDFGWIARKRDGTAIFGDDWRWNSRAVARTVALEADLIEDERAAPLLPANESQNEGAQTPGGLAEGGRS